MTSPPPVLTLSEVVDTFNLEQVNAEFFVGTQIDEIDRHIVGGHIAAQGLMAASRTVSERLPSAAADPNVVAPQRDTAERPHPRRLPGVYVAGRTLLESAMIARRTTPLGPGFSALMDLAMWFHHPPDLSDWLLYEQHSPSGVGGRGLAQGTMFNRTGQLVCTTTLKGYFSRG